MSKIMIRALRQVENGKAVPIKMPRMETIPGLTDAPTYRRLQNGDAVLVDKAIADNLAERFFCEIVADKNIEGGIEEKK